MKVQSEMATRISVDTISAVGSMSAFRNAITATTNAWKAQEIALKNSGDYTQAAKVKLDGLTQAMELQRAKIEELRSRQDGLDQSNEKQANQWLKLEKQISQANRQLASYESQAERAKNYYAYQSSGLADLQHSYKLTARSNEIFVEQLKAEGKNVKAQRAELDGMKTSLTSLKEQYNAQKQVVAQVAENSGKASNAYKEQKNKLDELRLEITQTDGKIKVLSKDLDKNHPAFLSGVREKLEKSNEAAEKSHSLFSKIFSANVAANLFTSALGKVHESFSLLTESVKEYDDKQQTMVATWDTLTGSAGKGQNMVNIGNKLAAAYSQNIEIVDELNQQFYHVFDNAPRTEKLTKSVLTLGDTLNMTDENVKRLGLNFTHMLSSGRMQLGDFNMITDQLPMYGEKLLEYERKVQNNSKLTMETLRDQMSAGKISAKDAETVMNELGDKYQKASENLMKTGPGMVRAVKTQAPALLEAFYKPIREMKNPLLGQVSKWVMADETKKEFSKLGDTLTSQVTSVTKALSKNSNFDFGKMMNSGLEKLNSLIIKLGQNAVKHKGDLKEMFNTFKSFSGTSFKVFVQTLKDLEPILKIIGGFAAKHPKAFAQTAAALLLINKATTILLPSVKLLQSTFKAVKFPITAIQKTRDGLKELPDKYNRVSDSIDAYGNKLKKVPTKVKTKVSAPVSAAKEKISGYNRKLKQVPKTVKTKAVASTTSAKGKISSFNATVKRVPRKIKVKASAETASAKISIRNLGMTAKAAAVTSKSAFTAIKLSAVTSIKAIGLAARANPLGALITGIELATAAFSFLYQHSKKFRSFCNGVAKNAKKAWSSIKKGAAEGWQDLKKKASDGADNVKRGWDKLSGETVRSAQQMFNKHKSTFQAGYKVIEDRTTTWHDLVSGRWDRLGEDTERTAQDMFKFNRKIFSDMYNKLNDMTGGRLGDMLKIWQDIFGKIKDAVGNAVGSVHRHFVDLVHGVLKPFKTMIDDVKGGINWVLDKVGGSKIGGDFSISMPSYANGTNDTHPGGFAKVNDGLTAHYREMFMTKDGQVGMFPAKRNLILPLPKGTSVLDGERSYQLSRMFGMIPHYADGVGNAFSSLLSKVGDATDDVLGMVDKIMSKPVEFMESVFQKFVHVSTPVKFAAELVKDVPVYIAKQMGNWIKKQFETLANPGGAGVERWRPYIIKAFKTLGVEATATKVSKLLKQIQTESGGNPTVPQKVWDINMANGNPAQGLLQFIPSTFNHWAIPGHKQILNGYDQILAAINALEHGGEGGWGNVGQGHGWANGGLISNHGVYEIAEKNMPEYVIPTDISRRSRAYQLLGEIVTRFRNDDPTLSHNAQFVGENNRQSDALSHKLDELLSKFDILLRLSGDQVDAIKAQGSLDMQQLYKKEAKDARMRQLGF